MRYHFVVILGVISIGAACFMGCNGADEKPSQDPTPVKLPDDMEIPNFNNGGGNGVTPLPTNPEPTPEQPPVVVKPTMPKVMLTEALNRTCLAKVGDTMPDATLNDLSGQPVSIRSLTAGKLTVVCFWRADHAHRRALEELKELQTHIVGVYGPQGVTVVAINEDEPLNVVTEAFRNSGASYPCLLDPRGAYFAKIATTGLPRTYLLDADGKILWFDTEYSRTTQRDLKQAIQFMLEPGEK